MINTIKTTPDGSKLMSFEGVEFWTKAGVITYVPSNDWSIVHRMMDKGLVTRRFYQYLYGHTEYILN